MTLQLPFKLQLKDFLQLTLLKFKKKRNHTVLYEKCNTSFVTNILVKYIHSSIPSDMNVSTY